MTLPTQTPQQFTDSQAAAFAGATGIPPVFTSGDPLLAFFQTISIQLDFLQGLIVTVVNLTRAQTSTGADLDAWMAQFAFTRLPATFADGAVTFSSSAPAVTPVNIAVGTLVQTSNGGIVYQVVADADEPTWNPALNAYVLAIGQTNLTAVVQAIAAGSAENVASNTLVQIASPLPGINTVTNPAPIANGVDAESDASFRARFVGYLASLAQATLTAILFAANNVQQGLLITPVENQDPMGNTVPGSFTLFVDDGSGNPPSQLLTDVYNAVFAVRAFGIRPYVSAPTIETATIVINVRLADGFLIGTVGPLVKDAIALAVNGQSGGATLFRSAVGEAALSIAGVTAWQTDTITINGSNADLVPAPTTEIRTSSGAITVGTY